jgi:hypothetical protein
MLFQTFTLEGGILTITNLQSTDYIYIYFPGQGKESIPLDQSQPNMVDCFKIGSVHHL